MRQHRHAPWLTLGLMLSLRLEILEGHQQPILVGKSDRGRRYYFELWPEWMIRNREGTRHHTVDGFQCTYKEPHLEACADYEDDAWHARCQMWMYTMDDVEGSRIFVAPARRKLLFKSFTPAAQEDFESPVRSDDPVVSAANRLLREEGLFATENEAKPAPNGVYHGFIEHGLRATIEFDQNSQVKHLQVKGPQPKRYNEMSYTMLGKALVGAFGRAQEFSVYLILEPVDPTKFDGSRQTFSRARMNTIEGWPVKSSQLPDLLGLRRTRRFHAARSRIARASRAVRNAASRLRRRGKDGLKKELLTEDDTEEDDDSSGSVSIE